MTGDFSEARSAFGADEPRKRASTAGYWLAGLIAVAAVGGAIAWFVLGLGGLGGAVDDLARVDVPGSAVVELEEGRQSAYWEGEGAVPALRIAVREVDGPPLEVGPHGGEVTYEVDGRAGQSVAGFTVAEAGFHEVTVRGDGGGRLAVGEGVGSRIVGVVVGGIALFFGGLLLSGLMILVTARRRRG